VSVFTVESPAAAGPSLPDPAGMPLERVEAEICSLAGQIAAATSRFLTLLADFDAREGWAGTGIHSCAHWLSWRCGLDLHTAHQHVRVARALTGLPKISQAFAQGKVSYSKVRAMCRVATSDNEDDLLDAAMHSPAAHLERLVRGLRTAQSDDDAKDGETQTTAAVQWRWDDDGSLRIWGRLSGEDGARLLAGLTRMDLERHRTDDQASDPDHHPHDGGCGQLGSAEPGHAQAAGVAGRAPADLGPALVAAGELLCTEVEAPVFAPAADVVVHVDAATLAQPPEADDARSTMTPRPTRLDPAAGGTGARIDDGPRLTPSILQMLACHARTQLCVHAPDGRTLDLGRRHRRPNRAQLDALWRRDRGCAHPGCGRTRFLHAHHVTAWAAGGPTDLDNLVLLCGEHHRALHDGQFAITALGRQRFRVHGPNGAERPPAPKLRGNATDVTAAHPHITPTTIEPDWDGTPLDLPHATDVYLTRWAIQKARRERTSEAVQQPTS
jgi:hypothetical protein